MPDLKRVALTLVTAVVLAACVPPSPPAPPSGSTGLDGVMTGVAIVPEIGGTPCEAHVQYSITLLEDYGAAITSYAKTWGTCPFEAWTFDAFVTCDPDCGEADIPMGYWPATVQLDWSRVPDFAHLTIHLVASVYGYSDGTYRELPVIRCGSTQCYFQA